MGKGAYTYRCLTGKCYPRLEAMKMRFMSREERLERLRQRYGQRGLEGKRRLLDEVCEEYGYHRKHAIRFVQ